MTRPLISALFVLIFASDTASARNLDYIDADGVTETGGSGKARMIPRTAADGRLDASLLPPVADWASQPIPGLRYVAPGAAAGGNGSPQYPYNSLAVAFTNSPSGTALLLAPALYDETVSLEGKDIALVGFGPLARTESHAGTRLVNLNVGVGGTSSLSLVGCSVGVLRFDGSRVKVRLSSTAVGAVHGTAPVDVVRTDMGSYVESWTTGGAHTERYDGYDLVTNAVVLVGPGTSLRMGADHPVAAVGGVQRPVAYVSELTGATNHVYASLADLVATNDQLAVAITAESATRSNAVLRLTGALAATSSVIRAEIERVDEAGQSQASALSWTISQVAGAFTNLTAAVGSGMSYVSNRVAAVEVAYKGADNVLSNNLTSALSFDIADARDAAIATAAADAEQLIAPVQTQLGTLSTTVDNNHTAHVTEETALGNRITTVNNAVTTLQSTLGAVKTALNTLIGKWNAEHQSDPVTPVP